MANGNVQLKLRTDDAKQEALNAIFAGVREVFQDKILPEAQRRSPKDTGENAASIRVRTRKTKNGPKATIFTTSGHGGFLEKGTSKMGPRPFLYPAYLQYAPSLNGTIKTKVKLVPDKK